MRKDKKHINNQLQELIDQDPVVISLKARVIKIRAMMGELYALRVELELEDYIRRKYPNS